AHLFFSSPLITGGGGGGEGTGKRFAEFLLFPFLYYLLVSLSLLPPSPPPPPPPPRNKGGGTHDASSAAFTSGRRSLPKNIALPTNIVGLPKPPRAISSSVLARSFCLQASVSIAAKKRWRSRPALAAMSASTSSRAMSRSSPQ